MGNTGHPHKEQTYRVMHRTHSQVVITAGSAGLQVEVREGEVELVSLAGSDGPVALGVGVVGQRVVRRRKSPRRSHQSPTTSFNVEMQSSELYHSRFVEAESSFTMLESW